MNRYNRDRITLFERDLGPQCLELWLPTNEPFPEDVSQNLVGSTFAWYWESRLLRDEYGSLSKLPKERPFQVLDQSRLNMFMEDAGETFEDERRFMTLLAFSSRPESQDGEWLRAELERFCRGGSETLVYVVVHVGDTPALYVHFNGDWSAHCRTLAPILSLPPIETSVLKRKKHSRLGVVRLEHMFGL